MSKGAFSLGLKSTTRFSLIPAPPRPKYLIDSKLQCKLPITQVSQRLRKRRVARRGSSRSPPQPKSRSSRPVPPPIAIPLQSHSIPYRLFTSKSKRYRTMSSASMEALDGTAVCPLVFVLFLSFLFVLIGPLTPMALLPR